MPVADPWGADGGTKKIMNKRERKEEGKKEKRKDRAREREKKDKGEKNRVSKGESEGNMALISDSNDE